MVGPPGFWTMARARQNGLCAAHFGDTVLLVPKKIAKKLPIVSNML